MKARNSKKPTEEPNPPPFVRGGTSEKREGLVSMVRPDSGGVNGKWGNLFDRGQRHNTGGKVTTHAKFLRAHRENEVKCIGRKKAVTFSGGGSKPRSSRGFEDKRANTELIQYLHDFRKEHKIVRF